MKTLSFGATILIDPGTQDTKLGQAVTVQADEKNDERIGRTDETELTAVLGYRNRGIHTEKRRASKTGGVYGEFPSALCKPNMWKGWYCMRYYVKSVRPEVDYSGDDYQPCWTCTKACGGCSWSRDFIPVNGWKAVPTHIPSNGEFADSYKIIECPEYENERR